MSREYTQQCFIVELPLHAVENFLEYISPVDGVKRSGNWDSIYRYIDIHELVPADERAGPSGDMPWRLTTQPYLREESSVSADRLITKIEQSLLYALREQTTCNESELRVRQVRREKLIHLPETNTVRTMHLTGRCLCSSFTLESNAFGVRLFLFEDRNLLARKQRFIRNFALLNTRTDVGCGLGHKRLQHCRYIIQPDT